MLAAFLPSVRCRVSSVPVDPLHPQASACAQGEVKFRRRLFRRPAVCAVRAFGRRPYRLLENVRSKTQKALSRPPRFQGRGWASRLLRRQPEPARRATRWGVRTWVLGIYPQLGATWRLFDRRSAAVPHCRQPPSSALHAPTSAFASAASASTLRNPPVVEKVLTSPGAYSILWLICGQILLRVSEQGLAL